MYYSITIGDKNTWDDWHLVSKSRPFFNPPTVKTKYIEIPGSSGQVDISEALTGYPIYTNREGTWDFWVLNLEDIEFEYDYKFPRWNDLYSEIMNSLNGKIVRAYLEDEPDYYYEGKFTVASYKPGDSATNPRSTLTIGYNVGPYKWRPKDSIEPWTWDDFSFEHGVIYPMLYKDIEVTPGETIHKVFTTRDLGFAAVRPEIIVEDGPITIRFVNSALDIDKTKEFVTGTTIAYDFVIWGDRVEMDFSGEGKVSIRFRIGRL